MFKQKKILFLVRLPPPMHGAAKMNDLYLNSKLLNKNYDINYIKLNNYSSLFKMGSFLLAFAGMFKVIGILIYKLIFWKPKLIYFEISPSGVSFLRDSIYIWICKLFNRKIICQLHGRGMEDDLKKNIKLKYNKLVFKNIIVILLSDLVYDSKKAISQTQVIFLPNGITNEISDIEFKNILAKRKTQKSLNLLYLSNMIPSKGAIDTLKICNLLNKDNINFKCYFAGAWESDKFKEEWYSTLKKYSLENRCEYLGPKYGSEKNELFITTNYLIFPTTYPKECYPLVILEAFMYGVPVLSYNTGAIREIINKEELGFVSMNNNYKDIYIYLKNNNICVDSKYIKIRTEFNNTYTFDKAEKKLSNIFKSVIR